MHTPWRNYAFVLTHKARFADEYGWSDVQCTTASVGLCRAPATLVGIGVSLPAGRTTPSNTASAGNVVGAYLPPKPVLAAVTAVPQASSIEFSVAFDTPVTGVTSAAFTVTAPGLVVQSTSVTGSGSTYTVTVDIAGGACPSTCPAGYTTSSGFDNVFCAKVSASPVAQPVARADCAPYDLMPVLDGDHQAFAEQLVGTVNSPLWYVGWKGAGE